MGTTVPKNISGGSMQYSTSTKRKVMTDFSKSPTSRSPLRGRGVFHPHTLNLVFPSKSVTNLSGFIHLMLSPQPPPMWKSVFLRRKWIMAQSSKASGVVKVIDSDLHTFAAQ